MKIANCATIADRIAAKHDFYKKDIEPIVKAVVEEMSELLTEEHEIYLHNFGKFGFKIYSGRTIPHPVTKETTVIRDRYIVTFTPLPKLKSKIAEIEIKK